MYYLYHIPGKKIGVTRNLNNRVTLIQGYKEGEYEVLEQSDDIDYISDREIELQKSYGYKVDLKKYKNLKFNKMKINATEQTSTFDCPVNKLKGRLMDNIGITWETTHGKFNIGKDHIPWIMANVKTSMFNEGRSYIYNKAFYEAFFNPKHTPVNADIDMLLMMANNEGTETSERFDLIRNWAATRGLYDSGNPHTQYVKLQEEAGELAKALLTDDKPEIVDAIGDMVVVLTNLAHLQGYSIEYCIDEAYSVIAARTGKMINGTFVKDK
jgi:NTP pyrophosphatase (non-canonical NTP hydrolase)